MTDSPDTDTWRLIDTGPLSGPENMAIDAALLECFVPGESRPVLRLYGWEPPAFSCGRFQRPEEILDLSACARDGIPVVRRITGGGVIFHGQELTYSLVCPVAVIPGGDSVKEGFRYLTSFLLDFYRALGLEADFALDTDTGGRRLGLRTPLCFAGTEECDILINGRKIGGNAQRRLRKVVFQHGSIPLRSMAEQAAPYLREPAPDLARTTTTLAGAGISHPEDELKRLLAAACAARLGCVLQPGEPAPEECLAAGIGARHWSRARV
jgi:lipoate-protein ligase A